MNTPKTPRHPSNGYEIVNGTPLVSTHAEAMMSPLLRDGDTISLPQCTYSPFASPYIRNDGRRRSVRLEMRSPAKHLDLRLCSMEEELTSPVNATETIQEIHDAKPAKRRRSLRLRGKQSEAPALPVVETSSKKKSNKNCRRGVSECKIIPVPMNEYMDQVFTTFNDCESLKSVHQPKKSGTKKRRQSGHFGVTNKSQCIGNESVASKDKSFVCVRTEGHNELVLALETVASKVLGAIVKEHELAMDEIDKEMNGILLDDSLDEEKENKSTISAIKRKKGRRDTFDLSRKRGLRVGPSVLEEACTPVSNTKHIFTNAHKFEKTKSVDITIDTSHDDKDENDVLQKKLFITPKNNEIHIGTTAELPRTNKVVEVNPEVKAMMESLSSVDVEERMKTIYAPFKVYNYPCVSARIFSAMSLIYTDNEDFDHLSPLLISLVNAEVVSLSKKDNNDVYFINKRVCFSGYDYSSTMPARDSIDGSHVDLLSSIEALKIVLQQAQHLSNPAYYLNIAIRFLDNMASCANISEICSKTLVGYFPSSRFLKAIKHYSNELRDIRCYLMGEECTLSEHVGVRFRLGDFIGRSVRFSLRKLLNSLPESIVDFFVEGCEDRWGRAVDDRSISSILNFSLEKVHQFMNTRPELFDDSGALPSFFTKEASEVALSIGKMQDVRIRVNLKSIGENALKDIASDLTEARKFLLGARACKFVWELLSWPGVEQHIKSQGGWDHIESISEVFYDFQLYEYSDYQHFILLRSVGELMVTLAKVVECLEDSIDFCERAIRQLDGQMKCRQKDHAYKTKGTAMFNLRMALVGEKGERFPIPMANYNC